MRQERLIRRPDPLQSVHLLALVKTANVVLAALGARFPVFYYTHKYLPRVQYSLKPIWR